MPFELPTLLTSFDVTMDDGAKIRVRRHGNPDGLRLVISHGNGFAVDAYFPFWQHFLADYDVVLFDFRNHGQNVPVDPPHHDYAQMSRDLERVIQEVGARLGQKKTVGIFHSMSGRTAMKHAIQIGWRWDGLVLFDPPNVPPPGHPVYDAMAVFENKLVQWARGRRSRFGSVEELTAEYLQSRATRNWVAGAHDLMARSVLRPAPDGNGFVLVCAPELEASIYAQALSLNLWPKASDYGGPVKLIGCDPDMPGGPATGPANKALATENDYDYVAIKGTGHLLQIEKPDECVRAVTAFLTERGIA